MLFILFASSCGSFYRCFWFAVKRKSRKRMKKKKRVSSIQITQFAVRIVFEFFFQRTEFIWTFSVFSMFIHFWWKKDPNLQTHSPKCQRNISSYFGKVFLRFHHFNLIAEKREWVFECTLKMNYECFVPVYQPIWLH